MICTKCGKKIKSGGYAVVKKHGRFCAVCDPECTPSALPRKLADAKRKWGWLE